jgi:16S rRNA (guanine(527)-N(7))-methyltransferase RsmG
VFHVKPSVERALAWTGLEVTETALAALETYVELLVNEGVRAGVLGPNEAMKIWNRHIADSICFAAATEGTSWLDVGSGGGLPGIPLAITNPGVRVTLLDRSGRRSDLVRRWLRVLGLTNADVIEGDVDRHHARCDTVIFRGSLDLGAARVVTTRLARRVGVFGLTHSTGVTGETPHGDGIEVVEIPRTVLDSDAALLRIAP